jgi:hypothetical protein
VEKNNLIQLTQNLYRLTLLFPKKEPLRYKMRELADDILANPNEECLAVLDSFFEVVKAQNWAAKQDILNIQAEYSKLNGELRAQPSLFNRVSQSGTKVTRRDESLLDLHSVLPRSIDEISTSSPAEGEDEVSTSSPTEGEDEVSTSSPTEGEDEVSTSSPAEGEDEATASSPAAGGNEQDNRQKEIMSFLRENGRAQVWQIKQILPEVTKRTLRRDFDRLLASGTIERMGERQDTFYQLKIRES